MKMNRRVLSLLLAVVMVLGAFTSVFAAETVEEVPALQKADAKIDWLVDNGYVEGYEDGELRLDRTINRAEITKLVVHAEGYKALAERLQGVMQLYTDVNTAHWANGVISVGTTVDSEANGLEMLNGYPNGTFQPEKDVTYAELAKMLVVQVKKDLTKQMHDRANTPARWAGDWMLWAEELGILEDVTVANSNDAAPRRDAFVMMYNAMYKNKYVKRVPANETRGIISQFDSRNNKLVINQGDIAKEYTIDENTVFVDQDRAVRPQQLGQSNKLSDYYRGSLVRVLTNDKGYVTTIIQLGNPVNGAEKANWRGFADETITVKGTERNPEFRIAADNGSITFEPGVGEVEVRLVNSTEYYVADVNRGQLTKVSKAEALNLLGGVRYNAYAGYDVIKPAVGTNYNEAKIVVFNTVAEDNENEVRMLRAQIQQSNRGYIQAQFTDGKTTSVEMSRFRGGFPFFNTEYGSNTLAEIKPLDVFVARTLLDGDVELEVVIRNENTIEFPIVEVVKYDRANRNLTVLDADNNRAKLHLPLGYNHFLEKDELKEGVKLQFALKKDTRENEVEAISILVDAKDTKGTFPNNVVEQQDMLLVEGLITSTKEDQEGNVTEISVREYDKDGKLASRPIPYRVSSLVSGTQLNQLAVDAVVSFYVTEKVEGNLDLAHNIEVKRTADVTGRTNAVQTELDKVVDIELANGTAVTAANIKAAVEAKVETDKVDVEVTNVVYETDATTATATVKLTETQTNEVPAKPISLTKDITVNVMVDAN